MTDEDDTSRRDAQRQIDALADLFDAIAPSDRAAADQELHDAGVDPTAVGQRVAHIADSRLAGAARARQHTSAQGSARRGHGRRPAGVERGLPNDRGRRWRRLMIGGALLTVGAASGLMVARVWLTPAPTRLSRVPEVTPRQAPMLPRRSQGSPAAGEPRHDTTAPVVAGESNAPTPAGARSDAAQPPHVSAAPTPMEWAPPSTTDDATSAQVPIAAVRDGASWILDSSNWQQAEGMLPPVVLERVKKGDYWYKVVSVDPERFKANYSKRFWEASEANAGKFDLDPQTCGLKDVATGRVPSFYFGYPFPHVQPTEPLAACKMAWNFDAATSMGEGQGATFTLNGIDGSGEFKRIKLWLHTVSYLGRHGGAIDNPENLRSSALSNVLDPRDVDGVGGLSKRTNDWDAQDRIWFYVPSTRRVRRVNAATRSDPVAGLDIFADDLNGQGGKLEYYKWKLIGEQTILAPLLSPEPLAQRPTSSPSRYEVDIPYLKGAYETPGAKGVPWLIVDNLVLVPRPVWVLEGESSDPYFNFGKVIMYMDKDMYRIYWKLVHDRAGEYFYNAMCAYHFSKNADDTFSAVTPTVVVGVNDKTNRACLAGRYGSQFIERRYPDDYFSLRTLTRVTD